MNRVWRWLREKRRHTLRKWRSSVVRIPSRRTSRDDGSSLDSPAVPPLMSASTSHLSDYETYFDDYEEFAVTQVDIYASFPPAVERVGGFGASSPRGSPRVSPRTSPRPSPHSTPPTQRRSLPTPPDTPPRRSDASPILSSPLRPRSKTLNRIRFNIPQVQVALEEEEPRRVDFEEAFDEAFQLMDGAMRPPSPAHVRKSSAPPTNGAYSSERLFSHEDDVMRSSVCSEMGDMVPLPRSEREERCTSRERRNSSQGRKMSLAAQRRQSNLVQSMSGRRTSTTLIPLTVPQIHLVRSLWRQIYTTKGPTVIGTTIFHRLCFKQPAVKEQMKRVPLPPQFNNHDSFIKAHCKALAELVDQVVENLDNLDHMNEELQSIGRTHARLLRGEINGKLWNVVAETFIDCTLEWGDKRCRSETVRKAWALIVAFMIEKIKHGHHEQRKMMLSTRASMPTIENLPPLASMKLQ